MDKVCTAGAMDASGSSKCQHPAPTMVTQQAKGGLKMNEQGSSKSTRVQVAGLWIAACSLALALLRTVFDVLEVMGR